MIDPSPEFAPSPHPPSTPPAPEVCPAPEFPAAGWADLARQGATAAALHEAFSAEVEQLREPAEDSAADPAHLIVPALGLERLPESWRGLAAAVLARRWILADGFAGWMGAADARADDLAVAGLARLGQAEAERALVAARERAGYPDPADPLSVDAVWTRLEEDEDAEGLWQRFAGAEPEGDAEFLERLATELRLIADFPDAVALPDPLQGKEVP